MKTLAAVIQSVLCANWVLRCKGLVRGNGDRVGRTNCVGCHEAEDTPIEDI
jgi:hypothetical protein